MKLQKILVKPDMLKALKSSIYCIETLLSGDCCKLTEEAKDELDEALDDLKTIKKAIKKDKELIFVDPPSA